MLGFEWTSSAGPTDRGVGGCLPPISRRCVHLFPNLSEIELGDVDPVAITLRNEHDARPRLEYYPLNSRTLRTVLIDEFPFIIGRGETAQLQIKSENVSRAHAELVRTSDGYQLRDLNSTNGTAVNGQPVSEAALEDGDSITIAGTELTFVCPRGGQIERMVTMPLGDLRKTDPNQDRSRQIWALRELHEALLWQTLPLSSVRVLDCRSQSEQAVIVSVAEPLASRLHAVDAYDSCSTPSRIQQLAWQLAAEHAGEISPASTIYLRVELHSGLDERLFLALDQAFDCLTGCQPLGIVLPWAWAVQSPETLALCAELKELGAHLAFDNFSGGPTCVKDMSPAAPDLLVLAPTLCRGISSNPRRMGQLNTIAAACEASEIKLVLPDRLAPEDRQAGSDNGLNLVLSAARSPVDVLSSVATPATV